MLTAISQALVYQSSKDLDNKCLTESLNMEYLNDSLWKAARFALNAKVIDPEKNEISTLAGQIKKMRTYIQDALKYFDNLHINQYIDLILKHGTEGDEQLTIYNKSGFEDLKKYLMNTVDYHFEILE